MTERAIPRGTRILEDEILSEGVLQLLERYLRLGLTVELACRGASISTTKYHRWRRYGSEDDPEYKGPGTVYEEFYLRTNRAEMLAAETAMECWTAAMAEDWKAASRFMAQRFPEEFSERRVQKPGESTGTGITINIAPVPDSGPYGPEEDPTPLKNAIDDIVNDHLHTDNFSAQ